MTTKRALLSVSDKTGLADFARELVELGFEIVSTGGTRRHLDQHGIDVVDVSTYTGFPEIMEGRVKTLHPKVHGAILGRPDHDGDSEAIAEHEIIPFQVVCCNLYPFEQTIARDGVSVPEAVEQIDIGGPGMVRSAAKNHAYVAVVTRPTQYADVLTALREQRLDEVTRCRLAAAAFEMTACYERAIADYMAGITSDSAAESTRAGFPESMSIMLERKSSLRYGENPHQRAAFFVEPAAAAATLARADQLNGRELSFNNLLDLDAALAVVAEFEQPAAVVIKHNNPCGCAVGETPADAFRRAWAGDPVSAFGSVMGFNRAVTAETAEELCGPERFVEAIIAPGYEPDAFELLTTRPKWKNNVRLMKCEVPRADERAAPDYRRVTGGVLVQDRDTQPDPGVEWQVATERSPLNGELRDLRFVWQVCRHVKSNAIVFARDGAVVGVGAGQMSRLDAVHMAVHKSADRSRGAALASDAFFPFRDGIDEAARSEIKSVIQPGGSRRDDEVIAACNEHGIAMIFTGRRHFKH